ncbi:hypothetical protein [Streptomyces sp. NPDC056188]|uniref:hypothetical protein n=1 Tax=Streptomyces sp. NPDC056188 TaxID=3345740 RepID=UPI0035E12226
MLVDFDDWAIVHTEGEELTRVLLARGMAPACPARGDGESGTLDETVAQSIAAGWVLGDLRLLPYSGYSSREQLELARPVWRELTTLPRAEQLARIGAAHAAAVSCGSDPLDVLAGGASR